MASIDQKSTPMEFTTESVLSPLSEMSSAGDDAGASSSSENADVRADDDVRMDEDDRMDEEDSSSSSKNDRDTDESIRLAFTFDTSNLDSEGIPKNKLPQKMNRNDKEKMRRDRFKYYIAELSRLIPPILSSSGRKLTIANVLRLTVNHLRIHHGLRRKNHTKKDIKWKPDFLTYENIVNLILESVNGFLLVLSQRNHQVIFTTDALTANLGHSLVDVFGSSLDFLIHDDDIQLLEDQFKGFTPDDKNSNSNRSFYLRMLAKTKKPEAFYKKVHIVGNLKAFTSTQLSYMSRSDPEIGLIGVGRIVTNESIREIAPLPDLPENQWLTCHSMSGIITYSHHHGAYFTGFLPEESIGIPAYSLVHPDDCQAIVQVHNLMLKQGTIPKSVFRMYTKVREILYITTYTNLVLDMWTGKPKYIISINEVMSEKAGKEGLAHQRAMIEEAPSSGCLHPNHVVGQDEQSLSTHSGSSISDAVIIPEIIREPSGNFSVLVGDRRFQIDLSNSVADNTPNCSLHVPQFDDREGKNIRIVKPEFLSHGQLSSDENKPDSGVALASGESHMPSFDDDISAESHSAISNLQAMCNNSTYPLDSCLDVGGNGRISGVPYDESWDTRLNYPCLSTQPSSSNHYHWNQNSSIQGSAMENYDDSQTPSNNARQNPTLTQLLNNRTQSVRETWTTHLMPGNGDDKACVALVKGDNASQTHRHAVNNSLHEVANKIQNLTSEERRVFEQRLAQKLANRQQQQSSDHHPNFSMTAQNQQLRREYQENSQWGTGSSMEQLPSSGPMQDMPDLSCFETYQNTTNYQNLPDDLSEHTVIKNLQKFYKEKHRSQEAELIALRKKYYDITRRNPSFSPLTSTIRPHVHQLRHLDHPSTYRTSSSFSSEDSYVGRETEQAFHRNARYSHGGDVTNGHQTYPDSSLCNPAAIHKRAQSSELCDNLRSIALRDLGSDCTASPSHTRLLLGNSVHNSAQYSSAVDSRLSDMTQRSDLNQGSVCRCENFPCPHYGTTTMAAASNSNDTPNRISCASYSPDAFSSNGHQRPHFLKSSSLSNGANESPYHSDSAFSPGCRIHSSQSPTKASPTSCPSNDFSSPLHQDVTSTCDFLEQLSPVAPSSELSPDHQAALQALLEQIAPSRNRQKASANCSAPVGDSQQYLETVISDPDIINNLLGDYATSRLSREPNDDFN